MFSIFSIVFLVLLVSVIQAVSFFKSPEEESSPKRIVEKKEKGPTQVIHNAYIIENDQKGKVWELWAKKGLFIESKKDWEIESLRTIFYGSNKINYNITADAGSIVSDTKDVKNLELIGHIESASSDDLHFKSSKAIYKKEERQLFFPEPIVLQGSEESDKTRLMVTGNQMTLSLDTNEISILGKVIGTKTIPKKGKATLLADRAVISKKKAHFIGHIVLKNSLMIIKGSEAVMNYKNDKIISATIINVTAEEPTKKVSAEKLVINMETNSYTFTGSPRVELEDGELTGDVITLLNQGRQIEVSSGKAHFNPETPASIKK